MRAYQKFSLFVVSTLLISIFALYKPSLIIAAGVSPAAMAWVRQFGGPGYDLARNDAVDAQGNVYVVGHITTNSSGSNADDVFVRKYDNNGNLLWAHQFGGSSNTADDGFAVSLDGLSNVYVTGWVIGSLPDIPASYGIDGFIIKYDTNGLEVWKRQIASDGLHLPGLLDDQPTSIATDGLGNVYVGGVTRGTLSGQTSAGSFDSFVRKYDSEGNEIWTRQFGTSQPDNVLSVAVDGINRVYLAGLTEAALPGQTFAGATDAFVRVYDSDGNEVWTRQFGTSQGDSASGITVDTSYNAYTVGWFNYGETAFVRKYDADGTLIWQKQFSGTYAANARGVKSDSQGAIYVVGTVAGSLPGQTALGEGNDAFIRKYNSFGDELWTIQFGTQYEDSAWDVALSEDNKIYVVGADFANPEIPSGFPGETPNGENDAYVAQFVASNNFPPVVNMADSSIENEGDTYSNDGSFVDLDSASWTATVDYGDGSGEQPLTLSGMNFSLSRLYKDNGTYTVTVSVTDNQGATGIGTARVNTLNVSPSVNAPLITPEPSMEGSVVTASAIFSDLGPNDAPFACSVDYGDSSGPLAGTVSGGLCTGPSHMYTNVGSFTVTVAVTDKDNGTGSNSISHTVVYNTPIGSNISVSPNIATTITFASVSSRGTTNALVSNTGPAILLGFSAGDPPTYYDITTTALYTAPVTVCLTYDPSLFSDLNPARLLHYENNAWIDVTTSNDTTNHIVCGQVNSLSPFVVAKKNFAFLGFYQPVDNLPTINAAKAGQAIPIKWSLKDGTGNYVSNLASITSYGYSSLTSCTGTSDTIEQYINAGSTSLRYDTTANQFILTSKTDKSWVGSCKMFTLILSDGTKHQIKFQFTK